jgi:NAD dependent epimerase/dehydratase
MVTSSNPVDFYRGKSVLVTGADGFIGSHLAEALVSAGARVSALSLYTANDTQGWLDTLSEDVRGAMNLHRGDVRDPGFMLRLAEGQQIVFHLAALIAIPYSYRAAQSYVDVNMTGTLNVLEAARAHVVQRVVHTSTSEVYGTAQFTPITELHPISAQSPYAASKVGADMMAAAYARSFETPVVILRPFNTYGPRQSERAVISSTIRQALDPGSADIRVGDLSTERDFTFVRDTVSAFLAAGVADTITFGEAYNCGSGRTVSIGDIVELIRKTAGTNKPVTPEDARFRPDQSEVRLLQADSSRFHEATGWTPAVALEDGIAETLQWWQRRLQFGNVRPGTVFLP